MVSITAGDHYRDYCSCSLTTKHTTECYSPSPSLIHNALRHRTAIAAEVNPHPPTTHPPSHKPYTGQIKNTYTQFLGGDTTATWPIPKVRITYIHTTTRESKNTCHMLLAHVTVCAQVTKGIPFQVSTPMNTAHF